MKSNLVIVIIVLLQHHCYIANSSNNDHVAGKGRCCGANHGSVLVSREGQKGEQHEGERKESDIMECGDTKSDKRSKYSADKNAQNDNKFILIKAGTYSIGTDKPLIPQDGEGPARNVYLDEFYINEFEVSNQEFSHFAKETGYVTEVC